MSDLLNQSPAIGYAMLLEFIWGESGAHVARYTTWSQAIIIGGHTYAVVDAFGEKLETRLKVEPGTQTGAVRDEPWTVTMMPVAPLTYLARDSIWAPVTCTISEVDPTAISPTPTVLWTGVVSQVWKNPREAPGTIKAEIAGWRVSIQYPLGVESKTGCSRTFGDQWCGFDLSTVAQAAVVTSLSGKILGATSLTIPGGKPSNYWTLGKAYFDGLAITIIDGSAGVSSLRMLQKPPPEWMGATLTFTPGCDKTYASPTGCIGFANTDRFFGVGADKPSGSPLMFPR